MSTPSERFDAPPRPGEARAGRTVAGRRRGAGKRFLVVGDVLDGVLVQTTAAAPCAHDPAAVIRHRPVGAAGNTATWLGWLGAQVDLVARVGVDDVYRHERALGDAGVRAHIRYDARSATGAVVSVRNDVGRTAMSDPAASGALTADDVPAELVGRADIVHLTGSAMLGGGGAERIAALVARARTGTARVSLDPSATAVVQAVGPEQFVEALAGVDVLFPSEAEAIALTGAATVADAVRLLTERVPLVVVTRAHDGVLLGRRGRSPQRVPITPATVVDTLGAGDAFAAGFLRAWATDPVRVGAAAREGTRVAARALGFVGGRPPV
ncbi:sugar/nucleoside kinase (ribokinase family) [Curtobacterium flaccumfaciens]|uniref:Sugar/nucleoside kinase (Ribokinase family) n=1 Tax=Curtobacterium flaccumfaciens TaxID=2035 RepID=A0A4R6DND6_9MICO|nr:PfkB family carbohydrate kinase [Curtobacterium flaccumfaciens]TDN45869.1 sugar/nucleoside kinase (ribokinase family) [Curtobacterium flaccumfaciens]